MSEYVTEDLAEATPSPKTFELEDRIAETEEVLFGPMATVSYGERQILLNQLEMLKEMVKVQRRGVRNV